LERYTRDAGGDWTPVVNNHKPVDDVLEDSFATAVGELIEGQVKFVAAIIAAIPGQAAAADDAIRNQVLEFCAFGHLPEDWSKVNPHAGFPGHAGGANPAIFDALKDHVLSGIISAMHTFKLEVEDQLIGRSVQGAMPGGDYDLHLRAFSH
jgi:hypothetical protein